MLIWEESLEELDRQKNCPPSKHWHMLLNTHTYIYNTTIFIKAVKGYMKGFGLWSYNTITYKTTGG